MLECKGRKIRSIYIFDAKDIAFEENGIFRLKRKYGEFKREGQCLFDKTLETAKA